MIFAFPCQGFTCISGERSGASQELIQALAALTGENALTVLHQGEKAFSPYAPWRTVIKLFAKLFLEKAAWFWKAAESGSNTREQLAHTQPLLSAYPSQNREVV